MSAFQTVPNGARGGRVAVVTLPAKFTKGKAGEVQRKVILVVMGGEEFFFDQQDWQRIKHHSWRVVYSTSGQPLLTRQEGSSPNIKNRYAYQDVVGWNGCGVVDHKNGDVRDNRFSNLRICTHQQNNQNRRAEKGKAIPYKGVTPRGDKFLARIKAPEKHIRIGLFKTAESAAAAYDRMASIHFGEFAWLNSHHFKNINTLEVD